MQQGANDDLKRLEYAAQEDLEEPVLTPVSTSPVLGADPDSPAPINRRRDNRSSAILDGEVPVSGNGRAVIPKRTSDLLNESLLRGGILGLEMISSWFGSSHGSRSRISALVANTLLQQWTDQSDTRDSVYNEEAVLQNEQGLAGEHRTRTDGASPFEKAHNDDQSDGTDVSNQFESQIYPKSQDRTGRHCLPIPAIVLSPCNIQRHEEAEADISMENSFRLFIGDTTSKVLPKALREYNMHSDWKSYSLLLVYEDQVRGIGLDERPLAVFKRLEREGKEPKFFLLRKHADSLENSRCHCPPKHLVGFCECRSHIGSA